MINLSFAAPSPSLPKTINSSMPTTAPPLDDRSDFLRSLDRMQAPRTAAPPPASKVNIDNGSDLPEAAGDDGNAAAESKRALDALGVIQRTAAARQAALRSAAQAAQAAESAKADKVARAGAGAGEAGSIGSPTDPVAAGPDAGSDCEYHPDMTPTDNAGIMVPPTIPPVEVPQPKRTMPALLPATGAGEKDPPALPPRLPPLIYDEAGDPRLSDQPPGVQPIKGDLSAGLSNMPVRTAPSSGRQAHPPSTPESDKSGLAASTSADARRATGAQLLLAATGPVAPWMPADAGHLPMSPVTLPGLLASSNPRATEPVTNPAAQTAAAALAAVLPGADNWRNEAAVSSQLQARPGSSEFAKQLGAQVAVWAKGGVQHASLHLNPLELGPVSVQIQLDGSGAQVSLAADLAATRQALEQALPSLASSLREAGLTLTGGGVFDQARQQAGADGAGRGDGNGNGNTAAADSRRTLPAIEAERAQRAAVAAPRSRGVVDLMA